MKTNKIFSITIMSFIGFSMNLKAMQESDREKNSDLVNRVSDMVHLSGLLTIDYLNKEAAKEQCRYSNNQPIRTESYPARQERIKDTENQFTRRAQENAYQDIKEQPTRQAQKNGYKKKHKMPEIDDVD